MNKNTGLLSAFIFCLLTMPPMVSAENSSENKAQIETGLSEVKEQKLQVQEEIKTVTETLHKLNQTIATTNTEIINKEKELTELHHEIDQLTNKQKRITAILTNKQEEFKDRVSSYYRTEGQLSFLDVIFSSTSFGDFIDRSVAYRTIINKDKKFIEKYIADQKNVAEMKDNVEALTAYTIQEKQELKLIKKNQQIHKQEKEKLSIALKKQKKQLEKEEQEKESALEVLRKNEEQILRLNNNNSNLSIVQSIVAPFVADAQKLQQEKGIPTSITLGQIILESSGRYNGLSGLAYEAKNLFGVKGTGTAGSVYMNTTEYINGNKITSKEKFAKYKTYYDSMLDHANLLLEPRYQKYLQNATSIADYAYGIHDAGYATDPNYANLLIKIIDQYDLTSFDV